MHDNGINAGIDIDISITSIAIALVLAHVGTAIQTTIAVVIGIGSGSMDCWIGDSSQQAPGVPVVASFIHSIS